MVKPSRISFAAKQFESQHVWPTKGLTLIVGSKVAEGKQDRRARFPNVVGVDMQEGAGVDLVHNLEQPLKAGPFDHVECMSVLEHCRRPWIVAANVEEAMRPGGSIFLTVPFVWRWHGYPSDYFRFTAEGVRELFPRIHWLKMAYASDKLRSDPFLKTAKDGEYPLLPRSEVMGFGRRM